MAQAGGNVGVELPVAAPTSQLLLAAHHERYTRLLRVFLAWKRRAQTQCVRRKRIEAACRVGAVFYQRIFWERWREFISENLERREKEMLKCLEEEELRPEEEAVTGMHGKMSTVESAGEEDDTEEQLHAAVLLRKRYFFKWKIVLEKESEGTAKAVVRFRSGIAVRRWRRYASVKNDYVGLQQRAYCFLYYWLLKRSLSQLGRHALVKRRERKLTVILVKASKQRLQVKTMQHWRLRLQLHQMLILWRSYVRRRQHQTSMFDALTRKTRHHILQFAFVTWEKKLTQNQAQYTLARVIDRHLFQKVCERAWRTWKAKVRQFTQLDAFHRGYAERRLRRVWNAWSTWTREKECLELQRRRAVRSYYLSLLRKGFNGLRTWHTHRQLIIERVSTMMDAADARIMVSVFARWDRFTSAKKMKALKYERASLHHQAQLIKRVWTNGFRCFFTKMQEKKRALLVAQEHYNTRIASRCFHKWKSLWQAERNRDQTLKMILQDFTIGKIRSTNAKVFVNWSEFTSSRAARRVVNAQVRGHAQRRVLQMHFAQWVTYISVLRWQQILCARAEQHYRKVILQKCFERWQHNVILRRRYRKKTRVALVHWKLTLQRRVFDGWKQYLHIKREKQQRIHEALEFRHKQFVRLGLRYWMTAALHLQEQREQRVTIAQASNTANIWRRVATIARHWRYLTIRRQAITEHREAFESLRDQQPRHQSTHWPTEQIQLTRAQEAKTVALPRNGNLLSQGHMWGNAELGFSRANERSPLSDFVLLPRNRPQPRRPIEVMLFGHADNNDPPQENEGTNVREALRCGFDFPAEPFAPLASPPDHEIDQTRCPQKLPSTRIDNRELEKGAGSCLATAAPKREGGYLPLPNTTVRQLDDLERQLLALSQRKKEWKIFQQQLEAVRVEADRNPRMRAKLQSLEEHHAVRTKQWLHTKGRIRLLATEIQQLRNAFQR